MLRKDQADAEASEPAGRDPAVAALAAQLEQLQRAEVRRQREAAVEEFQRTVRELDRLKTLTDARRGGPCVYCGVTESHTWNDAPQGSYCADCRVERRSIGPVAGLSDLEHRDRVVRALLSAEALGDWRSPFLLDRVRFSWWHETPGAPPGGAKRFAYVDVAELEARLRPAEAPRLRDGDKPCGRCGCAHMFVLDPGREGGYEETRWSEEPGVGYGRDGKPVEGGVFTTPYIVNFPPVAPHLRCVGCRDFDDFHRVIERLCGVRYGVAQYAAAALNLSWFNDLPERDPRRRFTLTPFAYLGDPAELRRRVAEVVASDGYREWTNVRAVMGLRAAAGAR